MTQYFPKSAGRAALALLGLSLLTLAPSFAETPALPPLPPATTIFFPLSQIHRGLQGVAYTVFQGDKPEPMGVEILGLLHDALGPHQDMILVRLEGKQPDYTGVVEGMSGSPVYVDGKLVGALSYRIGQFSKEPIGGVTPIQEMLQVRDLKTSTPANDTLLARATTPDDPANLTPTAAGGGMLQPIETPLNFSGFSPAALEFWKQHAYGLGMTDVSALGGGSDRQASDPGPLRPGDAVSAVLVSGDLQISATCTVTYVDARHMLACGHPISQYGSVSIPMTKAEVVATLPSPMNSFKIINTTQTIGAITQDRASAILGVFGQQARTIPVTLHIDGPGTSTPQTLHLQVIDQPQVTPLAVMVSIYQGLMQQNSYTSQASYRVTGTVQLANYPSVRLDNLIAPTGGIAANLLTALTVGARFTQIYDNAGRRTPIQSVDLNVEQIPERLTAQLIAAHADKSIVHAGDTITLEASLLPWHGEIRNLRIPVTLPASLPPGPVRLFLSDGPALDQLLQPAAAGNQPLSVAATIAQLNSDHPSDRLYVTLLAPQTQAALDGRTLPALPISMANVLDPLRQDHALSLHSESAIPITSLPVHAMLSGKQVITLQVVD